MCKTYPYNDDDITILGCFGPKSKRLRSNTVSHANQPESVQPVEEPLLDVNLDDPDDFFGLKISELMDIEDGRETPISSKKFDEPILVEEPKKKTDLQKLCGFQSYQHVIEKAIHCSEEKMLTLNQIYTWVEENIPYFHEMSRMNKSKCWKNAIRHNLSLHKQFYKVLRDGHRSCLWAVDKGRIKKGEKTNKKTLSPSFRPRSQTDPISVKSVKDFLVDNELEKILSGQSSLEFLPQDPVVTENYSSPSSNSSAEGSWATVPSMESGWSDYSPNYDCFTLSPASIELDCDAVIEHERHLYDNYPIY